jgi:hypothetical protein
MTPPCIGDFESPVTALNVQQLVAKLSMLFGEFSHPPGADNTTPDRLNRRATPRVHPPRRILQLSQLLFANANGEIAFAN